MKEIKNINLVFENCECFTVDRTNIGNFLCSDITADVARIACNSISKYKRCKEFFVELHNDANTRWAVLGHEGATRIFDRIIKYDDITAVEIEYMDGEQEYIMVDWEDADLPGERNKYQSSYLSVPGNLYVCISRERSVMDFVNKSEVDDVPSMENYWELIRLDNGVCADSCESE